MVAPSSPAPATRHRGHHDTTIGSVLVYSWQPVRALTGTDGARHAGMAQRLLQVVRSSCRLQLQVYYISGQAEPVDPVSAGADRSLTRRRGQIFVEGCRVTHFHGHTEAQYAHFMAHVASERSAPPLFCLLFYTGAWFPVEQRAIRNITGWHRPESYLDEDAYDAGTGTKAGRLLSRLRADHAGLGVVVFTDDIQSEKLARVLPATATQRAPQGDAARVRHAVRWSTPRRSCPRILRTATYCSAARCLDWQIRIAHYCSASAHFCLPPCLSPRRLCCSHACPRLASRRSSARPGAGHVRAGGRGGDGLAPRRCVGRAQHGCNHGWWWRWWRWWR